MTTAAQHPTFPTDGAPLSVLIDLDGTISLDDVGDARLARFAVDQEAVAEMDRRYDEGSIGSRALMRWDMDVLPQDADLLVRAAGGFAVDRTLLDVVETVGAVGGMI